MAALLSELQEWLQQFRCNRTRARKGIPMSTKMKRPTVQGEPVLISHSLGNEQRQEESSLNSLPWQVYRLSKKHRISLNHSALICSLAGIGRAA